MPPQLAAHFADFREVAPGIALISCRRCGAAVQLTAGSAEVLDAPLLHLGHHGVYLEDTGAVFVRYP